LQQPEQYRTPLQASMERSMTPSWRLKLLRQRAESHDGKANTAQQRLKRLTEGCFTQVSADALLWKADTT
jgi:hypothetical protein